MTVLRCLPVVAVLFSATAVFANPAEQLNQRLNAVAALRANFIQTVTTEDGELLQQAAGVMTVQRPRKLHWQTETPYRHLVVTDGAVLWLYDQDLDQISREPFSQDLDKAPALLLSGDAASIVGEYNVTLNEQNGVQVYTLVPKSAGNVFASMTLQFAGAGIQVMTLEDSFSQQTRISFSDLEIEPELAADFFQFKPPADVDVIDNVR